jgi:radical SAM protein with 4Fe4S-binding SPASM domain
LRRARDRGGQLLPRLKVFACVSRANAHHLEEMYAFARDMDAEFQLSFLMDMTHVLPPEERETSRCRDPGGLRLPKTEQVRIQRELARLRNSSSTVSAAALRALSGAAQSAWERLASRWYRDCARSREYVLVDPWGDVVPCEFLPGYSYGNCIEEGPGVWFSERRKKIRADIQRGGLPVCRECNRLGVHRYSPRIFRNLKRGLARLAGVEPYDPA